MYGANMEDTGLLQVQAVVMQAGIISHHQLGDTIGKDILALGAAGKMLQHSRFTALLQHHQQALGNTKLSGLGCCQPHQLDRLLNMAVARYPQINAICQPAVVEGRKQSCLTIGKAAEMRRDQ